LSAPFWDEIDRMEAKGDPMADVYEKLRMIYGGILLNGPFAFIVGHANGMIGLADRVKLRPMIAARKDDMLYIASEEAAIREISPELDRVWNPKAGEPVIGQLKNPVKNSSIKEIKVKETVA
jgi:glutamate synthase domain-containing protein 1